MEDFQRMPLVIVESPYAGDVEKNTEYARAAMADCLKRGEAPYASHLLYTQPGVLDDTDPAERKLGMEAGFNWHCAASKSVVYCDLGISQGMLDGIARAEKLGLPVERRFIGCGDASKNKMTIALTGLAGSGKSTMAKILQEEYEFKLVKFAGPLKAMVRRMLNCFGYRDKDTVDRMIEGDLKEAPMFKNMQTSVYGVAVNMASELRAHCNSLGVDVNQIVGEAIALTPSLENWLRKYIVDTDREITPRYIMQSLGTEWGRDMVREDLWVEIFRRIALAHERVVCDDCRFQNEAETLEAMGAFFIRKTGGDRSAMGENAKHSSENGISEDFVDIVIGWCEDRDELRAEVGNAVAQFEELTK